MENKAVTDMGRLGHFSRFSRFGCFGHLEGVSKKVTSLISMLFRVVLELGVRPTLLFLALPGKKKFRSIFTNEVKVEMKE